MKHILPAAALLLTICTHGQNLVPNWSFEEITECPSDFGQFNRAADWWILSRTPDLFNICSPTDSVAVPWNYMGNQMPFEGNGYAGLRTYQWDVREFIQTELTEPLTPGSIAQVTMRVSPGGFGIPGHTFNQLASSGVGLRLSTEEIPYQPTGEALTYNEALIFMAEPLNDTADWTVLSQSFLVDSAYRYVQIGNFFDQANTITEMLDTNSLSPDAYAFIDAVCIVQGVAGCHVVPESIQANSMDWSFPSVIDGELTIDLQPDQEYPVNIEIYDLAAKLLQSTQVNSPRRVHLQLHTDVSGCLLLRLTNATTRPRTFRLMVPAF
jgi:hypothetical protein